VAITLALVAPAGAATAHPGGYHTPGYTGTKTLPHVAAPKTLPKFDIGGGVDPHVLVDAAGTAHITYNVPAEPSVIHYCRLLRAARTCQTSTTLVPPGGDAVENLDIGGAWPLAVGNELLLLDHRNGVGVPAPDGKSLDEANYLYASEDGGTTFTGPGIVGTQYDATGAIAFGPPSAPQIGALDDISDPGTVFFQGVAAGAFTAGQATLGSGIGGLALDGTKPVVSISNANTVTIREYTGTGDVNDPANWSTSSFGGRLAKITGGPTGAAVLYQTPSGKEWDLRRISDGRASATTTPITSEFDATGVRGSFGMTQTSGGGLAIAFTVSKPDSTTTRLELRTSGAHGAFTATRTLATFRHNDAPAELGLGSTPDGGGIVTYIHDSPNGVETDLGKSEVAAVTFGSLAATGAKGLGNLNGSGAGGLSGDPTGSTSCTTVHFGDIDALAQAGCFLRDPSDPTSGAAVAQGDIELNGLELIPDAGVSIVIDPRQHTINTTGKVSVVLRAPGIGDITLYHEELHINLGVDDGDLQTLFQIDTSQFPIDLEGFGLEGLISVQLTKDGVQIPISVKLPAYMGGATGAATLIANNTDGLVLTSLHIGVADLVLPGLEIKNLAVDYTKQGDVWKGAAELEIPPGSGEFDITAMVEFDHGDLTSGSFQFGFFPGVPIFTDAYLFSFGGGFDLHPPKRIFGDVVVGALQQPPGSYALAVTGNFSIVFGDPVVVSVGGTANLEGEDIAQAMATFRTDGYFETDGSVDLDLGFADIDGTVKVVIDLPDKFFSGSASGDIKVGNVSVSGAQAVVSSRGIGACIEGPLGEVGFSYVWGGTVDPMLLSCDVSALARVPVSRAARAAGPFAHAASAGVPVPSGAPVEDVLVSGAGAPPSVVLTSPAGQQVVPSSTDRGAPALAMALPETDQTLIAIEHPAAGTWQVAQAPGSSAVTAVSAARAYAAPNVKAQVNGHGTKRTLTYTATTPPGTSVRFVEQRAAKTFATIGSARGASGRIAFTPAPGPAGTREIDALLDGPNAGTQRIVVAHYSAPAPARPGRVRVRVRRSGKVFVVHLTPIAGASGYSLRLVASDGRHLDVVLGRRPRDVRLPFEGFADRLKVTVSALSATGPSGPTSSASASGKGTVPKLIKVSSRKKR
jgi:hypothetical protein